MRTSLFFVIMMVHLWCSHATRAQGISELVASKDRMSGLTYDGISYIKAENYVGAQISFKGALNLSATDVTRYHVGVNYMRLQGRVNWMEGIKQLVKIEAPENFRKYWTNLSIGYILNDEYDLAHQTLQHADTASSFTKYLKGVAFLKQKRYSDADSNFKVALGQSRFKMPLLPVAEARYRISRNERTKKQAKETLGLFIRAKHNREDKLNLPVSVWGAAMSNAEAGKMRKAFRLLSQLNQKDSTVMYARGFFLFLAGKDSIARSTFQKLVILHPKFPEAHAGLGHLASKAASLSGNSLLWQKAITHYSKAISLAPKPELLQARALSYLRLYDFQKVNSDSNIALAINDFLAIKQINSEWKYSYDTQMAIAKAMHYVVYTLAFKRAPSKYFDKSNMSLYLTGAINAYKKVIETDSTKSIGHEGLGSISLLIQDDRQALQSFQTANKLSSTETSLLGIGMTYFRQENIVEARKYFAKSVEAYPEYSSAMLGLGLSDMEDEKTKAEGFVKVEKAYLSMQNQDLEDITKASITFSYAHCKSMFFTTSSFPQTEQGFQAFLETEIIPVYEEASVITPIADSSVYFINCGWLAEKYGFPALASEYYRRSGTDKAANNIAVMLAKNNKIADARELLEKIETLDIARANLKLLDSFFFQTGKLTSLRIIYLHHNFQLGEITPVLDNYYFPEYKLQLDPLDDFYPYPKPAIIYKYAKNGKISRIKHRDRLKCPQR